MKDLKEIFEKYARETVRKVKYSKERDDFMTVLTPCMSYDQFQQAISEVFEKIQMTDEEVIQYCKDSGNLEVWKNMHFKWGSQWRSFAEKQKLEKLLKP